MIKDTRKPGAVPTALLQTLSSGTCRTVEQLIEDLGVQRAQVTNAALLLLRRDYLMRMGAGCYQLTELGLSAAAVGEVIGSGVRGPRERIIPRSDTFRQRAWRSMRIRRRFTVGEIASDAETPKNTDAQANASRIIAQLVAAGYISPLPHRKGCARKFILTKDTGPRVPAYREGRQLLRDFNTKEDVPCRMR
tara:strand:- start:23308 stop:23883 length:576 start_codon:yes stop_codon:yes gene_type:complete